MQRRKSRQSDVQESRFPLFFRLLGWNPFEHRIQREIALLGIIGLAVFYFLAIISFNPGDPSPYGATFPPTTIANAAGKIGAVFSSIAIRFVGLTAFLLPLPFLSSAFTMYRHQRSFSFAATLLGWMILGVCSSSLLQWWLPSIAFSGISVASGGELGIRTLAFARTHFGDRGIIVVATTLMLIGFVLASHRGIFSYFPSLATRLSRTIASIGNQLTRQRATAAIASGAASQIAASEPLESSFDDIFRVDCGAKKPALALDRFKDDDVEFEESEIDGSELDLHPEASIKSKLGTSHGSYTPPPVSVLRVSDRQVVLTDRQRKQLEQTAENLTLAFADFAIKGKVIAIQPGPVVTVFEFQPDAGTKIAKILSLIDDIALALKVESVLMHPVKGKRAIGVQVPNIEREHVYLGDIVSSEAFASAKSPLTFAMGKSLAGDPVCADLTAMPHLLMAGATGAGKSVAINSLLCSVIMKAAPAELRMILVDPKMLELSVYDGIPHLLMPVITDPAKASMAIRWAVHEMERRYRLMQAARVRHIAGFNQFWDKASLAERQHLRDEMRDDEIDRLPYVLVVIDELADLMLTAPKEVESSIQRIAQKARASGIHLVLATQRPSVDIITGVIKANLPCRISFQTVSKHDSRTILDQIGSEKLLGKGDLLFMRPGTSRVERIQGALIEDREVLDLVASVKVSGTPNYDSTAMNWIEDELTRANDASSIESGDAESDDPKYDEALQLAAQHGAISASFLQRHLKIGYNRAARLVETMEAQQLVAKADGAKPRKWLGPQAGSYG